MKLGKEFFNRNTVTVARDLLGKRLVRKIGKRIISARITETEAYRGPHDRASHASRGYTLRTKVMFGFPGTSYVYLIYGMYHCLNFVTEKHGYPAAVLIRGIDEVTGLKGDQKIFRGPGKLCKALDIDRTLNDLPLGNGKLWIEDAKESSRRSPIQRGKRIGVDYAGPWKDKLWRFWIE